MKLLLFLLIIGSLEARGGGRGGGGRGGGGRGSSGARRGSSLGNHGSRPGSTHYSSFSKTVFHTSASSNVFRRSSLGSSLIIITPRSPILYGSYHYYWRGHYVPNSSIPHQCDYEITDEDQELRNVTYSNGTLPKGLTFGCLQTQGCCGLECCDQDLTAIYFIFGLILIVLLFKCFDSFIPSDCCEKRPTDSGNIGCGFTKIPDAAA